ncbi:hypothetical protein PG994_006055 [Apiospora phragmitis]|uniref:Uncharacterized protein n=1 Tax=Apiospora phragmitis TaxID=2905665 RepID=A0ABR1VHH9_9PEZI
MPPLNSKIPPKLSNECNAAKDKSSRADVLLKQGKVEEAEALLREALHWSEQNLGATHKMTAVRINLAAWQAREKAQDSSPNRHSAHLNLARDLTLEGKVAEAAAHFERVYISQLNDSATFGRNHARTLFTRCELATCWFSIGDETKNEQLRAKAKGIHEDVLKRQLQVQDIDPLDIVETRVALGEDYYGLKEYFKSQKMFSAGAMSLKLLEDAAAGEGGEKGAGDQTHISRHLPKFKNCAPIVIRWGETRKKPYWFRNHIYVWKRRPVLLLCQ